ncbi:hypothetical protein P4S72_25345 [Vibrio sp. PP-XX7]
MRSSHCCGCLTGHQLRTKNAIIGMVLSVITYGIVNAIITRYAIREGLSVALFSRRLFGSAGASLATLIFFSTAIYYAVFEGSVIAVAINHLFPALQYHWASLIVVLYSQCALVFAVASSTGSINSMGSCYRFILLG